MAADKVHLLLVPDVDLILQDFRLFLCVARQDAFQSPVGVTKISLSDIWEADFLLFVPERPRLHDNSVGTDNGLHSPPTLSKTIVFTAFMVAWEQLSSETRTDAIT